MWPFSHFQPTIAQWRIVFVIAACVYIFTATFYNIFASGTRQPWDNPDNDEPQKPVSIEAPAYENGHSNIANGTTTTNGTNGTTTTYRANNAAEQRQ